MTAFSSKTTAKNYMMDNDDDHCRNWLAWTSATMEELLALSYPTGTLLTKPSIMFFISTGGSRMKKKERRTKTSKEVTHLELEVSQRYFHCKTRIAR